MAARRGVSGQCEGNGVGGRYRSGGACPSKLLIYSLPGVLILDVNRSTCHVYEIFRSRKGDHSVSR